jgi:PhoH-like ATPase
MPKVYVLDTNVILYDPACILNFDEHILLIPLVVLEELDNIKKFQDSIGKNARTASKILDELRSGGSLKSGVIRNEHGGILKVITDNIEFKFVNLNSSNDNYILGITRMLMTSKEYKDQEIILVTNDINLRVKADALGIRAEAYENSKIDTSEYDKSYCEIKLTDEQINSLYSNTPDEKALKKIKNKMSKTNLKYFMAEGSPKHSAIGRYNDVLDEVELLIDIDDIYGIYPKNIEQRFLVDALFDDQIDLVVCNGVAGSGKTLLSLAVGLFLLDQRVYNKMLVYKSIVPFGRDIGYLKGDKEEKLKSWLQPFYDNLEYLFESSKNRGSRNYQYLFDSGLIEIDALTYIRGRSIPKRYIIIDESQNLSTREIKTIVSRIGENSKLVLLGDTQQIDNIYLDADNNGLVYVMGRMGHLPNVCALNMTRTERSRLADQAIKFL